MGAGKKWTKEDKSKRKRGKNMNNSYDDQYIEMLDYAAENSEVIE